MRETVDDVIANADRAPGPVRTARRDTSATSTCCQPCNRRARSIESTPERRGHASQQIDIASWARQSPALMMSSPEECTPKMSRARQRRRIVAAHLRFQQLHPAATLTDKPEGLRVGSAPSASSAYFFARFTSVPELSPLQIVERAIPGADGGMIRRRGIQRHACFASDHPASVDPVVLPRQSRGSTRPPRLLRALKRRTRSSRSGYRRPSNAAGGSRPDGPAHHRRGTEGRRRAVASTEPATPALGWSERGGSHCRARPGGTGRERAARSAFRRWRAERGRSIRHRRPMTGACPTGRRPRSALD